MENQETMSTAAENAAETAESAAAAEVVAPQGETAEAGTEGAEAMQQATEGNQPTEGSGKPKQSRGKNDYYAKLRRKAEFYDSQSEGIMALARSKGLQPMDAGEALEMLQADHKGQSIEEYRQEIARTAAEEERMVKGSHLYQEMQRRAELAEADAERYRVNRQMREDLAAIQEIDPSVTSLEALEGYVELAARGIFGVDAYYMLQGEKAVKAAAMPPSPGKVGGVADTGRDFTGEELDHLTYDDLMQDESLFKRAIRSLGKIRK